MGRYDDLRVVAFGGGTGLPVLLRGLKDRVGDLTAVVTVADDGGSSGRLRQELGVAPPGDVRNCLVALAGRRRLAEVFNYRFEGGGDLSEHSVGNIIIAALADMAGGFCEGVEQAARFLRIKGRVYPAATESLTLVVTHADGTVTRGESVVREVGKAVGRVEVEPAGAVAPAGVLSAIERADVIVLSPGSLFTSTIPALLGAGTREALASFAGPVVYAANAMTQPGETVGFALSDHLRALAEHVGPVVTDVLVHSRELPEELVARYEAEGAAPVEVDRGEVARFGVRLRETILLAEDSGSEAGARHDPDRLAEEACEVALVRL
ncbi:MAG TPA: gluconeogenesis factor YvcK family protein [Rubrobacteraceae bacterium]|nr:gluconeogenesis factor YvcK family protein [Rubrobacteraceae bacterium]